MGYDIITVGSATVDTFIETDKRFFGNNQYCFPVGAKLLIKNLRFCTGGSATNTAAGFSRLGLKTAAICSIGMGGNSKRVMQELKKERVDTSLIERNDNQRTGFSVIMDAAHHDRTIFAFKGSNDLLGRKCLTNRKVFKTRWMYFGSLMGKSFATMKALVKEAHKRGIKIAFNPSLYLAKKGHDYLKGILSRCDVVILNKEEAQALFNEKSMKKCLDRFHKTGVKASVVTDGSREINAYDGERYYKLKPRHIRIVETTGAGDAFGSGFVGALARGKPVKEALKFGLVNSESVIRHVGAKEKLLRWGEAAEHVKDERIKVSVC